MKESSRSSEQGHDPGLSMPHKSTHKINLYQNVVTLQDMAPSDQQTTPPQREEGDIKTFSRKSRMRMMKKILAIRYDPDRRPIFITLTYHLETQKTARAYKLDIARFVRWLNRYDDRCRWIWKVEFQKRGAVHFHLIYFPNITFTRPRLEAFRRDVSEAWHEHSGETTEAHRKAGTNVQYVKSDRGIITYVAKYVTKDEGTPPPVQIGRFWAASSNFKPEIICDFECNAAVFFQLRRLLRRWLKANQRKKSPFYRRMRRMATLSAFIRYDEMIRAVMWASGIHQNSFLTFCTPYDREVSA